jgi:ABC-type amino acid transport/signal transduction systems, periplasmic component/domain
MRFRYIPFSFIFLLCSILVLQQNDAAAATPERKWQLVTGEYAPYSGKAQPEHGLSSRLIDAILAENHLGKSQLHFLSWPEGYRQTADGKFDATYPYAWDPERDKLFLFSKPLHTETISWYSHKENTPALRGEWHRMRVCLPQGWNTQLYDEVAEQFHLRLTTTSTLEECLLQLQRRQSDLMPLNEVVFNAISQQLFGNRHQLLALPYYQRQQTLHLIVPKRRPDAANLIAEINQGIDKLQESGRYSLYQQLEENNTSNTPRNRRVAFHPIIFR